MTSPSISKSPLPITVPAHAQLNPAGATAPNQETSNSFQDMLSKAAAPLSVPPAELSDTFAAGQAGNPAAATPEYTIRRGDTLSEVVAAALRKQGGRVSRSELYKAVKRVAAANGLANPDHIFPGQKIRLMGLSKAGSATESLPVQASSFAAGFPAASPIETRVLQPPAHGRLSSRFGMRTHPVFGKEQHHDGIDISLPSGTPIQPIEGGTVTFAGENGGYGLLVEIDHGNGLTSRYAHLAELLVSVGEEIKPGRPLGLAGQSGLATGPHLHLEIRRDHKPVNPLLLLSQERIETEGSKGLA